jgi:3-methyladenine DNA glycosylase AlkD
VLTRPLIKKVKPFLDEAFLKQSVLLLWKLPEREYQYLAINLLYTYSDQTSQETLLLIEKLVTTKSWWDSVDSFAGLVGKLVWRFPDWKNTLDDYSTHENFWLRRIALLYQLSYKDKTDSQRLFRYCRMNAAEEEFFIRKAIGWALREYSKTNPNAVSDFLNKHQGRLSALSIREASKYL